MAILAAIGALFRSVLTTVGQVVVLAAGSLRATLRVREGLAATWTQCTVLSGRCLIPVMLVAGPIGAMLAMQSLSVARAFGVDRLLPPLVSSTIVRELAPGFAAVMVCFQAGAGIAAELSAMRVQEELSALEVMGLDPRGLVFGPRILGVTLATVLLNAVAIATGMLGAYLIAVPFAGMPHAMFIDDALAGVSRFDLWLSESKAALFGLSLGAVSATFGASASGGAQGVGQAANRAVVTTVVLVLVMNYLVNTALLGTTRAGGIG